MAVGWNGNFYKMGKKIKKLSRSQIEVGIIRKQDHVDNGNRVSMASLYFWHDQGTKRLPKRESLKPAIGKVLFNPHIKDIIGSTVRGDINKEINSLGSEMRDKVKKEIFNLKAPSLSKTTLIGRNGSNPLVDTGQLMNAIEYSVR